MSVRSIAAAMVRRRGSSTDDVMLKAVGALALLGVLGALLNPTVAALTPFVLYTIWTNGPHSSFMQGAYEPILLLYGQLFPPLLIAALGTIATVFVEWVNYHVYRRARDVRAVQNLTGRRWVQRVIRTFDRYPFVVIVCCALGFVPYTVARCLSVLSHYPVPRHLAATAVGRFPRLWLIAGLGMTLTVPTWVLLAVVLLSFAVAGVAWLLARRSRQPVVVSLASQSA